MLKTADIKQYRKEYYLKKKTLNVKPKVIKKIFDKKQYQKEYYIKHRDKILAHSKLNKEKNNEYHRKYYQEKSSKRDTVDTLQLEKRKMNALKYYYAHRDAILKRGKERRKTVCVEKHFDEIEGFTINFETV